MAWARTGRHAPGTRAKDSDRTDACQILDSALADGQLSMEEHRTRVSLATGAETLGDLQSLVSDLQTTNPPAQLSNVRKRPKWLDAGNGWGMRLAVAGVLVILGVAIGWGLYGDTSSPLNFTSDPGAKPDGIEPAVLTPPRQLHSLGGLTGLMEQMRQRFGDTTGYRLVVYPEYAVLSRPDPGEDRRELNYTYRGGWDDPTSTSRGSDDREVDLSTFDARSVVGVLRGAPETLGFKPADVTSIYLTVDPSRDPTASDTITVSVNVSSDYGGGSIDLAGDGTIKRINYPT